MKRKDQQRGLSRRGFLGSAAVIGVAAMGGVPPSLRAGFVSAAYAQGGFTFPGKDSGLTPLGDNPLVAETPESLLDDDTTPISKFFIRNNGAPPEAPANRDEWKLTIDGLVDNPIEMTLAELKEKFTPQTFRMVLECGGNGRAFFDPPTRGNQWTNGGMGCAEWTGVRLRDVLEAAGVQSSAIYTAHYGADTHLSGDPDRLPLSRGVPIEKAMEEHNLIVWEMNGEPLPDIHGGPLRLLIGGWPGSASHKWLTKITLRDVEHDGQGMTGTSYRLPIKPMIPGSEADPANFRILESMPVRSIISTPANGATFEAGTRKLALRGAAWAGDHEVTAVHVSTDFGASWHEVTLAEPKNRYDWRRWTAEIELPSDGYFEIWARATDDQGVMQPHLAGNWNPQGYGGNPMQRVAILVG